MIYRLKELVNTIVANAGGAVCPSFDITLNDECIRWTKGMT